MTSSPRAPKACAVIAVTFLNSTKPNFRDCWQKSANCRTRGRLKKHIACQAGTRRKESNECRHTTASCRRSPPALDVLLAIARHSAFHALLPTSSPEAQRRLTIKQSPPRSGRSSKNARVRRATCLYPVTSGRCLVLNTRKVRRIMRLKRWTLRHRRRSAPLRREARVHRRAPGQTMAHRPCLACVPCDRDGHADSALVIDCCTNTWAPVRSTTLNPVSHRYLEPIVKRVA
jgi:hypothetical protein